MTDDMGWQDRPKILMVDDKPENLLALERLLQNLPVELYKATSGNEALTLTLHHDFSLALLDIQMPEMDGYELAELFRQEKKTERMPFIFISAIYTDHINVFQGYEKGAFSYIVKPFEPEILLNKVKLFIDMYEHERQLYRRTKELERINHELEAFNYSVSHDLRAPLRAIDGFSQVLEEDYVEKLDEAGRDYLERIRNAAQRMGVLIDDLLQLSRLSRTEMIVKDVRLDELAEEVVRELERRSPSRDVQVDIDKPMPARGDSRLLKIVLENLVGNAWKFTKEQSPAHIKIGETDDEGGPVYFVRDNGAGFDMQYAQKLFDAFQRLHDERRFSGHGIGLATVQRIIHRHGGRVWAQAAPDEGATFYFTL